MAFEPEKISYSNVNGGKEYTEGSMVSPEDINKWFRSGSYSQTAVETFTENVDFSEINGTGEPFVGIVYKTINGQIFPYLKFANLKGKTGASGLSYGASLSNEIGDSEVDGYTKNAVNSIVTKPNLFINGDFRINQRGIYSSNNGYTFDRWRANGSISLTKQTDYIQFTSTGQWRGIRQTIDNPSFLSGKTITFSAKAGVDGSNSVDENGVPNNDNTFVLSIRHRVNGQTENNFQQTTYHLVKTEGQIVKSTVALPMLISDYDEVSFVLSSRWNKQEIRIYWAKLELGELATPYCSKPYSEELKSCQYYYKKIELKGLTFTGQVSQGLPYISTPFKIDDTRKIRTITVNVSGAVTNMSDNSAIDFKQFGLVNNNAEFTSLSAESTGVNGLLSYYANLNGNVEIDAEIY